MITLNRKLRMGIFNQHSVHQLDLELTPVEYIQKQVRCHRRRRCSALPCLGE